MYILPLKNKVVCKVLQANVEHRIAAAASQVTKSLSGYKLRERPMEKVNDS